MQQGRPLMERDPCPDRILDDIGASFGMGAVGGSFFHFVKGLRNSPNGARFAGGMEGVRMNVPRVAGHFAVWCGLFSACDCAIVFARQKEDHYNSIIAGAATGGILAARQGLRAVACASLQGGAILALVSGFGIMMTGLPDAGSKPVDDPFSPHGERSYLEGLFGAYKRRVQGGATSSSNKTETCKEPQMPETFDVPSTPPPSFEYK
uniref:Mitochondrial import inner membrane translocase subunit TIM17 n=1 Tax=Oryza punctata TaxID=4537 RepID=A0A0E0LN25_ORYPU